MDLLLQEKMSHVEELRQIHADINAVNYDKLLYFVYYFASLYYFLDGRRNQKQRGE